MSRSYREDYIYGKKKENEILEKIKNYFNDEIEQTKGRYERSDYKGLIKHYELKSRLNNYSRYPTTMFDVEKCRENLIILINFLDGLYYIEYNSEEFQNFERGIFKRPDRIDHKDVEKEVYYIPINKLIKIN